MYEKIKRFWERLDLNREHLIRFSVFLIIVAVFFFLPFVFHLDMGKIAPVVFIVLFSILFLVTWFMAGLATFRSLFVVGAQLTLMIFLADTYCKLPDAAHTANASLQSLFGFGILYVLFLFIQSLYTEFTKGLKTFGEIYDGKKPWIIVGLYAVSIGLFLWQLYEVMKPIVFGLCIYQ